MSSSVWYEQIDKGLIEFIQSIVVLPNSDGITVPVPVRVRKADEDLKKEDYPMVTIYNLFTSKRDEVRYYPFDVLRGYDPDTAKGTLEKTAVPYTLHYQIDFWSTLQRDMNAMLAKWEFLVSRDFNLPVVDSGGVSRTAHALQKGDMKKTDRLNGTERIFHSSITYRIWGELDENLRKECNIVTNTEIPLTGVSVLK